MTTSVAPAMTGAELRVMREYLGLSTAWLAGYLKVSERKLIRWESDELTIPDGVVVELNDLYDVAATVVRRMTVHYTGLMSASEGADIELTTFRTDEDYWKAVPQGPASQLPARWHRMVAARVAENVPGLILTYH